MKTKSTNYESVRDEDIKVGDFVELLGTWRRVVSISPYTGPHDFIFGIAKTEPGSGFSLCRGSYTNRAIVTKSSL